MADDDDAQVTDGPGEYLSPSGPRRSSYTPPSNDEQSREAAASVFNDDAIAAAMAAELAKVASGPIPVISTDSTPEPPRESAPEPVPESTPEPAPEEAPEPAAEAPSAQQPTFEQPVSGRPEFEQSASEQPTFEQSAPEQPTFEQPTSEEQPVEPAPVDETPAYLGAPAPTVPPAFAPPPPGYEQSTAFSATADVPAQEAAPAEPAPAEPAPVEPPPVEPAPAESLRPRRQALADEDLLRSLNDNSLSPEATLEVIGKLQAQLEQRAREASEYAAWEESKRAEGTPEALAEVESARAEFAAAPAASAPAASEPDVTESAASGPAASEPTATPVSEWVAEPAAQPAAEWPAPPHAESVAEWSSQPVSAPDVAPQTETPVSSFAPESSSPPEPPLLPAAPPALETEPPVDIDWASRWAPPAEPEQTRDAVDAAPTDESTQSVDESVIAPPAGWNDDPIFRFVPSAPTVSSLDAEPAGEPSAAPTEEAQTEIEPEPEIAFPGAATAYEPPPAFGLPAAYEPPTAESADVPPAPAAWPSYDVATPGEPAPPEAPEAPAEPAPTMSAWEQALAETSAGAASSLSLDEPGESFDDIHSVDDVHPLDAEPIEAPRVSAPPVAAPPVDAEPSLEGTAFADLLASAPPPAPPTGDSASSAFPPPVTGPPAPQAQEEEDESPFASLFDPPAPDAPAASFAPPAFLPPPSFDPAPPSFDQAPPPAPEQIADQTIAAPPAFSDSPLGAPVFDAPPPADPTSVVDVPPPATAAPVFDAPPPPPFTPPALVEPPQPAEVPPDFSSQIGVVPSFDAPPPPTGATPQPIAIPDPPAPFTAPSETALPAPFAAEAPAEQAPAAPANFDALLAGGDPGAALADPQPTVDDSPGESDPPNGGPVPFGGGVARGNATDPAPSSLTGAAPTSGSFGTVAVSTTGVAVVGETVPMEAPVSAPLEIPPPAPVASSTLPVVARPARLFSVEFAAAEPTPLEQRIGRAARLFWLWFAPNSSLVAVVLGALIFLLGMSLRQAVISIFVGVAISILPLALTTLAGKRSGQPTLVVSRATFGLLGNIVPAIVALASRLLWGAALLWIFASSTASILLTARAGDGFNRGQLTFMLLVLGFLLSAGIAYFGYALLARVQLIVTIVSAILVVGFIALTARGLSLRTALTTADGSWLLVVTGVVLAFSFVGIAWANSGSDLARYQRPSSSGAGSMAWASFGTVLPSLVLIGYGAVLAASHPELAARFGADPIGALGSLLPSWYPAPLIVGIALSLLSGTALSLYSGGFAVVSTGIRVRRPVGALIAGAVVLVLGLVLTGAGADITGLFRDVATTMAVPVAAWIGLFATETMIRRRRFDSISLVTRGGVYADVRWANLIAFLVISAIGLGLVGATVGALTWEGYLFPVLGSTFGGSIATDLAPTDIGVIVALLLGLLFPLVAGVPAIRRQESSVRAAE